MPPAIEQFDVVPRDQSIKLENPDPNPNPGTYLQNPAAQVARQRQQTPKHATITPYLDRLCQLPEVRAIPWRIGQELPPEKSIESTRVQQRGATLLSTRGQVSPMPCEHCTSGNGRFSLCITLENWFQGGCCGCIFTSKGNKCSLRFQKSGTADGRALRYHTDNPEVLQTYINNAAANPKPSKKRKRQSAPPPQTLPGPSSYAHVAQSPQLPNSPDMDTILQDEIAREHDGRHGEKKRHRHSFPSRPNVASVRGAVVLPAIPRADEVRRFVPSLACSGRPDTAHLPTEIWPMHHALEERKSVTPGSGFLQDVSGFRRNISTPVIDTLPKPKQRQIYSIVSGLQGGIDQLQKQLDSLKALLGLDVEESAEQR